MNRSTLFAGIVALVLIGGAYALGRDPGNQNQSVTYSHFVNTALATQFEDLRSQTSNSCGGGKAAVYGLPEDGRLQGSCCGPMDMHSYEEQITGLQEKYGEYEIIPPDPYDVSVAWAKEMIEYSDNTVLTAEQQAVYDRAVELSSEGGPCCCVCWHWYSYEGLAKHLIVGGGFSAEQIAEIWDLSDACGGGEEHSH